MHRAVQQLAEMRARLGADVAHPRAALADQDRLLPARDT